MTYTIGAAAKLLGTTPSALRYYDREGLLPHMERSGGGTRVFADDDLDWLRFIDHLKSSGMPIKEIKRFVDLYLQGDATLEERRALVHGRKEALEQEMKELQNALDFITYKCWYYDEAVKAGTAEAPRTMSEADIPPKILKIKKRCGAK